MAAAFIPETVTTTGGTVPLRLLAPFGAGAFLVRMWGIGHARRNGRGGMPWVARVLSWASLSVIGVMLGLTGSTLAIAALAAFVVLDAAGGLAAKDEDAPAVKPRKSGMWKRMKRPLLIGLYLVFVALFHFGVSIYLPFGTLLTWSLLSLGFAVLVRAALVGPKAVEADLRAPLAHRRHERREEQVADPQVERVGTALQRLRAKKDAAPLLSLLAQAAEDADLPAADAQRIERLVQDASARGFGRDDAALDSLLTEIETLLSPDRRTLAPEASR